MLICKKKIKVKKKVWQYKWYVYDENNANMVSILDSENNANKPCPVENQMISVC